MIHYIYRYTKCFAQRGPAYEHFLSWGNTSSAVGLCLIAACLMYITEYDYF